MRDWLKMVETSAAELKVNILQLLQEGLGSRHGVQCLDDNHD